MKSVRTTAILIFLVATFSVVNGQPRVQPKKISAKENYAHSSTHFNFSKILFGDYQRESIYSFDKNIKNQCSLL